MPQPRPQTYYHLVHSLASSPFLEMNPSSLKHPLSAQPTPLLGLSPSPFEAQDSSNYRKAFLLVALASPSYPQMKEGDTATGAWWGTWSQTSLGSGQGYIPVFWVCGEGGSQKHQGGLAVSPQGEPLALPAWLAGAEAKHINNNNNHNCRLLLVQDPLPLAWSGSAGAWAPLDPKGPGILNPGPKSAGIPCL